jgi:hypothetical protein
MKSISVTFHYLSGVKVVYVGAGGLKYTLIATVSHLSVLDSSLMYGVMLFSRTGAESAIHTINSFTIATSFKYFQPTIVPTVIPPHTITTIKSCNDVIVSGVYNLQPSNNGPTYQVYCDIVTPGGPWMLLYSYNHIGGENKPLVDYTVPISPTEGYSHAHLDIFKDEYWNGFLRAKKVRFYCQTSAHNRVIHFYTSNDVINQMAFDGIHWKNDYSLWTTGYTTLSDHTGYLPAATNRIWSF